MMSATMTLLHCVRDNDILTNYAHSESSPAPIRNALNLRCPIRVFSNFSPNPFRMRDVR